MKYKYKLCLFDNLDCKSIENNLNDMMAKGYELIETGSMFWVFKKCKANKRKYAAVLHEEAVEWESGVDEFDEYCSQAGWAKTAKINQVVIYSNENLDAVDISTDPRIEYGNTKKYIKKNIVGTGVLTISIFAYLLIESMRTDALLLDLLSDYSLMFLASLLAFILCGIIVTDVFSLVWIIRSNKMMAESNEYLETSFLSKIAKIEMAILMLMFIAFFALLFLAGMPYTCLYYCSYLLFICGIMSFFDKAINQLAKEDSEEKTRKTIERIVKGAIFALAVVLVFVTMGGKTTEKYESEGTIWLYKYDGYSYTLYYPKSEKVYDFVLGYVESHNEDKDIVIQTEGKIFVIEEGTPPKHQETIIEKGSEIF